jgi:Peptidase family S49
MFFKYLIVTAILSSLSYTYFNDETDRERNHHVGHNFKHFNYVDVHHPIHVSEYYNYYYNSSFTDKVYLVYDFDTLNPISRTGIHLHNEKLVSGFENFASFISYVIHNFNPNSTNVIVRISSPGGAAYQFAKLYTSIKRLNKMGFNTTAFIDDICASGGYMIACAFDNIYATETAQIGSVGVTMKHTNYHGLLEMLGIKEKIFGTGKYKGMNNFNGDSNLEHQ